MCVMTAYLLYLLLPCLHAKFQQKILTIALVIAKFKYLTVDPLGGQRRWGKTLTYRHWVIMVYSEKLLNIIALMKCKDYHTQKLI